jgi:sugar phosphate isomerase/epimerase
MMQKMNGAYPFRLGTSSYIIPDEILPNVRYLADQVDDVELVLFEVDDGPNNLPGPQAIRELAELARDHNLTYTVHLPLDLRLGAAGEVQHVSLQKARRVIECTRELSPWAFVLHLEGRAERLSKDPKTLANWQEQAVRALELVAGWAGSPQLLAVENLEGYPPDFNFPVLERIQAGICLDIGHLWLDGHAPLEWMHTVQPRLRVIHMHGIGERDHQSLGLMQPAQIDAVLGYLVDQTYQGVLTLELFSEPDFKDSLKTIRESISRIRRQTGGQLCGPN